MQEQGHLFAPYFIGDLEKPDSKLDAIVSAHLDAGTDPIGPEYFREMARQKAAIPDDELRLNARELLLDLHEYWSQGVLTAIGLGELLAEKHRRMTAAGEDLWSRSDQVLAGWLAACLQPEDIGVYCPTASDVHALAHDIARSGNDGLGRPGFLDITD